MIRNDVLSKTRVFLSYSRSDVEIAIKIKLALDACGIEVFRDIDDTLPSEEWWGRLKGLIEAADSVVFLLSPHSASSHVCADEVAYASALGKRIFPAVVETVLWDDIPEGLTKYQSVFLTNDFDANIAKLISALLTNIEWVREHTRLYSLALDWAKRGQSAADLLRGRSLDDAERWLSERPATMPSPGEALTNFILQSRLNATKRSRRYVLGAGAVALGSSALAAFAVAQRNVAITEKNRALANLEISIAYDRLNRDPAEALSHALDAWKYAPGNIDVHRAVLRSYYEPAAFPVRLRNKGQIQWSTTDSWFSAAFTPDSRKILTRDLGQPKSVFIVGLDGGSEELPMGADIGRTAPAASADGKKFLVFFPALKKVSLREINGKEAISFDANNAEAMAFSPDGKRVAYGWSNERRFGVTVQSIDDRRVLNFDALTNNCTAIAFSPDGAMLGVAADKKAWLIRLDGGGFKALDHPDYVTGVAFSPNGETIATTCWDGLPRLWWRNTLKLFKSYTGHVARTYSPRFSPDGRWLATASWDGTARVWWGITNDVVESVRTLPTGQNSVVEWSPDGRWLATANTDSLTAWDVQTPRTVADDALDRVIRARPIDWAAQGYSLRGDYTEIQVAARDVSIASLKLEFEDKIYKGQFTSRGGLVAAISGLILNAPLGPFFPFHPDVIEALVFEQARFGKVIRVPPRDSSAAEALSRWALARHDSGLYPTR